MMKHFLVLLLLALGACAAPPAPAPTTLPTPPPASPEALRPTGRPPPSATPALRPLTLWVAEEGPDLEAVRALAVTYTRQSGVPLELLARPPDGLRLSLATAELRGEPLPDLFWGDQEALAGLLVDGQLQPVPAEAIARDALPALLTAATIDGERWGVPLAAQGALLLFYNRFLIDIPPVTSDQLITSARAAETPEVAGLVLAWDEARWVLPWLHAFGGAPTSADGRSITLDTPAMTPTLDLMRELYAATSEGGRGYGRAQRLFEQGYAAQALDGDWALDRYRVVSATLELGIAPFPQVPAGARPAAPTLGGSFLMLGRDLTGRRRDQALAFAAFLTAPTTQARIAGDLGRLPASRGALAALPPDTEPALLAAATLAPEAPGLPPTLAARCALYGIDVWLPSLLSGRITPEETPAAMQREAEACLERSQAQ